MARLDDRIRWWEKALASFLVAFLIEVFVQGHRNWGLENLFAIAAVFAALLMVAIVWPRRRRGPAPGPPRDGSGPAAG